MNAKHSPLPWFVPKAGQNMFVGGLVARESDGRAVAHCAQATSEADAEFIVRVVNSHDDLMDLAKHIVRFADAAPKSISLRVLAKRAAYTIAKAEGR
jgi:hypothetical protein